MIGIDFDLEPEESIRYLESKGYRLTYHYKEMMREAHHKAFTVAKVTRLDLLYDIHNSLIDAQRRGIGFTDWRKGITPTLRRYGWLGRTEVTDPRTGETKAVNVNSRRLKTIFATNDRVAYMVQRHKELMEDDLAPYWAYKSALLENTRASHAAMHNRVYRRDDPFWDTWYPPNAWHCQCYVVSLSRRQAESGGYKQNVPYTPNGDKDWSYNVGATDALIGVTDGAYSKAVKALREAEQGGAAGVEGSAPKGIAGEWGQTWARAHVAKVLEAAGEAVQPEEYRKWAAKVFEEKGGRFTTVESVAVGALDIRTFDYLSSIDRLPKSAVLTASRKELTHLTRDSKVKRGAAITTEQALRIPEIIKNPKAILWDMKDPALLYAFDIEGDSANKLVIRLEDNGGKRKRNEITTAGAVSVGNLRERRYHIIEGGLD